jgi:hypothetical protein
MYNSNNDISIRLQEYFKNDFNDEIPFSTKKAIENTYLKIEILNKIRNIKRIAAIIICAITVTSGVVFADNIVKYISSIFTSTTESIDIATQNGYVQNVNMDFVYDKDIGIKVDNVIMDESKLDISYLYKVNDDVDKFELYEYTIKDNDNYIWYRFNYENYIYENPPIITGMHNSTNPIRLENNIIKESILYSSNEFPKCKKLFIEVDKIRLNNQDIVEGNWKIEVNLDDKFNEREKIIYEPSYNEHIINSEIYLTETTLKVSLELDELYDDFIISNPPFLENNLKKQYSSQLYNRENLEKTSIFNFEFEISKYDENIDTFYLTIPINEEVIIRIELNKK